MVRFCRKLAARETSVTVYRHTVYDAVVIPALESSEFEPKDGNITAISVRSRLSGPSQVETGNSNLPPKFLVPFICSTYLANRLTSFWCTKTRPRKINCLWGY